MTDADFGWKEGDGKSDDDDDDDDEQAKDEDGRILPDALFKGLSVLVNEQAWQRVSM
jgi:major membrane immunogen (membrane-anchored lipoprotein)